MEGKKEREERGNIALGLEVKSFGVVGEMDEGRRKKDAGCRLC